MKCISIYPEYVQEIIDGTKVEEYRNWETKYRGKILIATTKTIYTNAFICLMADLIDCKKNNNSNYKYSFVLDNIQTIKPLPVKGQQRIYNVDYTENDIEILDDKPDDYIEQIWKEADEWIIINK